MPKISILIIGAGFAGIAAARELLNNGYSVTILEARDRIGGRAWTDDTLGIPFDLGAFMFHGIEGNPLYEQAKEFNIELINPYIYNRDFGNNQSPLSAEKLITIYHQLNELSEQATTYAAGLEKDIPLEQAIKAVFTSQDYPALDERIYPWAMHWITLYAGAEPKYLSASNWNKDELVLDGAQPFVIGGHKSIVNSLIKGIPIHLNTQVNHIHYDDNGVTIRSNQGSYQADAVLITVPLGVLKKKTISFEPPLPQSKLNAIDNLKMGALNRIALKFPKAFWPKDAAVLTLITKEYNQISWFINYYCYSEHPILVGGIPGDVAIECENLEDKDVVAQAMTSLRQMYGNDIPSPEAYVITHWNEDPYSYGSYSYIPVGASGNDYDLLAQSVDNKLFFAGEATNRQYPATSHGAYFSGLREAKKILLAFT